VHNVMKAVRFLATLKRREEALAMAW